MSDDFLGTGINSSLWNNASDWCCSPRFKHCSFDPQLSTYLKQDMVSVADGSLVLTARRSTDNFRNPP